MGAHEIHNVPSTIGNRAFRPSVFIQTMALERARHYPSPVLLKDCVDTVKGDRCVIVIEYLHTRLFDNGSWPRGRNERVSHSPVKKGRLNKRMRRHVKVHMDAR